MVDKWQSRMPDDGSSIDDVTQWYTPEEFADWLVENHDFERLEGVEYIRVENF